MNDDETPPQELDIGVSVGDAVAIKSAVLAAVREGHVMAGDVSTLVDDLIGAFKDLDNNVFARDEIESALRKKPARDLT